MEIFKTQVWCQPWEVTRRLGEMDLELDALLDVVRQVLAAGADATAFHAANAEGMFRYQAGVYALRDAFVGSNWAIDRENNIESIKNDSKNIKVAFANVDLACNDTYEPMPRSKKGAGAERACQGNMLPGLDWYKSVPPQKYQGYKTFYLLVDDKGAAELSCPIISGDTFELFVERIYLSDGSEFNPEHVSVDNGELALEFDPLVLRK